MDRFLVNMAIIRVNLDRKGSDILDNYMPLVHEALDNMDSDVFSVDDFKKKFIELSEFKIPTGAVLSLLKRATMKYGLLAKKPRGIYEIQREKIRQVNYRASRDAEQRRYNRLVTKFVEYCGNTLGIEIEESAASTYFFEVLFDIAPLLFRNLSDAEAIKESGSNKNKYFVARFVAHANKNDQDSFEAILSFVRGSILTETFYYSQNPADIENKPLKRVVVYFDTEFLVRVLGYSNHELSVPCEELLEMLREMNVKTRCFRQTLDEVFGIFFAALNRLDSHGRLNPRKPGDVFDYINQKGLKPSDLLIIMNGLEIALNEIGVYVEERPEIIEAYSIKEAALSERLASVFETQSEKARQHDIDCLQAIHQLRFGKKQQYLDRCKAIFITTNAELARQGTLFFNEQYGHSNASVVMGDHVFTSLVWMKSVKKVASLPKDRLVANCYSALLPSESLWSEYIKEVNNLQEKGTINETDYHVLIYGMAARENLMEQAFSSEDNMFGSVENILRKAKQAYTVELSEKLSEAEKLVKSQKTSIKIFLGRIEKTVSLLALTVFLVFWAVVLGYALLYTRPESITVLSNFQPKSIAFLLLLLVTLLNLIFGLRLLDMCRTASTKFGTMISNKVQRLFVK